jgi:TPR repeat protein
MARMEIAGAEMAPRSWTPSADTYFELGLAYATGREVEADLVIAHKWFNLAALQGNREAARYRQELAAEMSASEIAEAQRAAREWIRTH